jgi:hypothetical protein
MVREGVIVPQKHTYADTEELKVDNIYAAADEQYLAIIEAESFATEEFSCTLAPVANSNFKDHKGNNNEHKTYIVVTS